MLHFDFLRKSSALLFTRLKQALTYHINQILRGTGYAIYSFSVSLTMGAGKHSRLLPRRLRPAVATTVGDIGFLILDFLKKSVWRMTGSGHKIVFVGSKESFLSIVPLFFDGPATYQQVNGVFTFGLSRKTETWLNEGCDMVICELSRLHPFRPKTSVTFTVPQWVNLLVTYPDRMDALLAGNRRRNLRRQINTCREAGCQWRFSRSRSDFDFFYERLYLPFVRSRHGEHAHIAPYPFQWDMWIKGAGGGLVLVTQRDKIVAGAVSLVVDGICYGIELGVRDADETLLKQGIIGYIFWSMAEWGKAQGAKFYNMGGTAGWRSNGAFRWKSKWGARVISRKYTCRRLTFGANRLSPALVQKINEIGFFCEKDECYYSLILDRTDAQRPESELSETIRHTRKEGLLGVCVISPEAQPRFFSKEASPLPN